MLRSNLRRRALWERLLADSIIGSLIGLVALAYAASYAALVFSGDLSAYLPFGVTSALIGTTLVGLLLAAQSSMRLVVVSLTANNVAILPLIVTPVARAIRTSGSEADVLPTAVAALALSTALAGVFLFGLGRLRLGRLVRLMPHAVVGGYTAGTGWLIISGAFKLLNGEPLSVDQLPTLAQPPAVFRWLLGLAVMLSLLLALSRLRHVMVFPAVLIGSGLLFYACLWLTGTSTDTARSQGWLLPPASGGEWYMPWGPPALAHVQWAALLPVSGTLLSVPVIAAIAILLTATGSEIATRQDANLDHELTVTGLANVASAALGGLFGMQSQSLTVTAFTSRARGRAAGMATALVCAAGLFLSGPLLSYVPTPILAGLLFYTGTVMVREWLYFGWFRLSHLDYLIVVTILVIMAAVGLLQGVTVGLVIACFVFAFNYSRTGVVKHELSGADHRSNLIRSFQQKRVLERQGHQVAVLILQGYIFFGTANSLYERVRALMDTGEQLKARFILLDFHLVSGLDASALRSFTKMKQTAEARQVQLVFTDCGAVISAQMRQSGILRESDPVCRAFADLDHGLEWCETQLLDASSLRRQRHVPLALQLDDLFLLPEKVPELMRYLEPLRLPAGTVVYAAGDGADGVYFIEAGQVTVTVHQAGDRARRVQTLGGGTVVGEMGLYQATESATSAVTDRVTQLYRLSRRSLQKMEADDPALLAAFHQLMAGLLAQRLARADREIERLLG